MRSVSKFGLSAAGFGRQIYSSFKIASVLLALASASFATSSAVASEAKLKALVNPTPLEFGDAHMEGHFDTIDHHSPLLNHDAIAHAERHNHFVVGNNADYAKASFQTYFDRVASQATPSSAKLAELFKKGSAPASTTSLQPKIGSQPAENLASRMTPEVAPTLLAFADASPAPEGRALAAIAAVAPLDSDPDGANAAGIDTDAITGGLPAAVQVPLVRPEEIEPRVDGGVAMPGKIGQTEKPNRAKPQRLAYARPENPAEMDDGSGLGDRMKNLFGRPRAGRGVAVYDISAARVYMPDGSVLEAHSGIGKMADNPRYTHVQMNGPTPAHTYNLRMRERRFHGVEAIRMLPVDGKNKFGRDGFLTHSYLLRGRTGQSHGCVAFKDYDKFLRAFKQGKVKQMIVVPGGGSAIARNVAKGKDA